MYNNFSSKKTKKVISALLASALVVTSAPITANAATAKVVGIGKTFTIKKTTKVSGLSKAEKKIVKVTVNKKKRTVTVKGLKAGKATFKIGKKAYTVMVGATSITKKTVTTNMTAGETKTLSVNAVNGKGDTIQFTSSKKGVVKVNKASAKANAKNVASTTVTAVAAGTAKITAKSKFTGKSKTFTIKVEAAAPAATTAPAGTDAPEATTGTATTAPATSQDPAKTEDPNTTKAPNATDAPETVTGGTITVNTNVTGASIKVVSGTTVVASTENTTVTNFVTSKLQNGTYTVVVTKDGYVSAEQLVVVNGDVAVNITLNVVEKAEITSINAINVNKYTDEYETLELNAELPTNAKISVKFSGVMDTNTVNINTIKLYETEGNVPAGIAKVEFNKAKTVATIIPASLKKNTSYKIVFTSEITSAANNKLAQTEYTFKTSSEGVLNKVYSVDAPNYDRTMSVNTDVYYGGTNSAAEKDDVFYIELDSTADEGSINSDTVVLKNLTDNTTVNIRAELVSADASTGVNNEGSLKKNKAIKITLLDNLKMKKNYRFEINGVRLANGGKLTSIVFPFVTDSTAPVFVANQTLNGTLLGAATTEDAAVRVNGKLQAVNLPTINTPEAGFGLIYNLSAVTDNATVTADAFALTDVKNNKNIPFTFTYDEALKQVKIVPNEDLPENTVVKIITSVDNKIKNNLGLSMAEGEYFVKSYDLTAPTVTSVEGETTNLKVGTQHKITVNFSEEIGYGVGTTITDADLTGMAVTAATQKLDGTNCIALVKAGVDPTESISAGDFIKIDRVKRSEDKKSIEVKFTPSTGDIGKTFQLVLAGKNDENRKFICDFANGTGASKVANPLASDYKVTLTTELQDVTGPVVEAIGTIDAGDIAKVNDDSKFKAFTDGAHNIDETKNIAIRFNEQLTFVGTTFNTATDQNNADGNVVLEKYNFTTNKWDKVDTTITTYADKVVDNVAKKDALYIKAAAIAADSKYRLTITPSINNNTSVIKDAATDANTMGAKYTVEFTTGKVAGLNVPTTVAVTDKTNALSGDGLAAASAGTTKITNKTANDIDNVGGADNILAIELADGSFMFTTQVGATDTSNGEITINDALTSSIKEGAKLYNLSTLTDGILAQYATGVEKDEPILVKVTSNAQDLNADTIKDAVKLYKTSDNSVVDADITYYVPTSAKNTAWVSINPKADLEASTNYYVKVDGLKDRLGNEQDADSKKKILSFKTATEDKKASVSDFNIYDGQMNVGVKTAFTFKVANADKTKADIEGSFKKDVQHTDTTLTADKIEIVDATSATGDKVDASVSYDEATGLVTVTPTIPLKANTEYQLRISKSTFSNTAMDKDTTINFQTGEAKAPAIKSVKHIEAGGEGLVGDRFVITLDSAVNSALKSGLENPANFATYFEVKNGSLTGGKLATVSLSDDYKVVTVVYGDTLGAGDYIADDYSTIATKSALNAKDTDTTPIDFGTDAVKVTK